jgi:hypothetical protein
MILGIHYQQFVNGRVQKGRGEYRKKKDGQNGQDEEKKDEF